MVQTILGPDHDLAKRLSKLEKDVAALNTRDVLQNATFGPNGTTVAQAFAQLTSLVANQVAATTGHSEIDGFSLSTTPIELARVTITVPTGYTKALVLGATGVSGANPSSSLAFPLKAYCDINGATSTTPLSATLGFISQTAVFPSASAVLTGLSGGSTFYVRVVAYTGASSIPANAVNRATVDAAVTFLK